MKHARVIQILAAVFAALPAFVASATDAPTTADELLKRCEAALKAKDKQALLSLCNWEGVSADMKERKEHFFGCWLDWKAHDPKLAPLPSTFTATNELFGIWYKPNVDVVGLMAVKVNVGGGGESEISTPYGKKNDHFYLSNPVELRDSPAPAVKAKSDEAKSQ